MLLVRAKTQQKDSSGGFSWGIKEAKINTSLKPKQFNVSKNLFEDLPINFATQSKLMVAIDKVAAQSIKAATCNLNSNRIFSWEQLNTAAYIAQKCAPQRALKAHWTESWRIESE